MPVGFATGHQVVQASVLRAGLQVADGVRGDVGQQVGTGGCAPLVVDDGQALALLCQAQHGLGEVAAARGVDPAGAQDQVLATRLLDALLAFQLGAAVDAERCRRIGFHPGAGSAAIKHVVGAVVHQPGAQARRLLGQHARRSGVEGAGELGLAFGFVHGGVGGGIDDDVGAQRAHGVGKACGVAEVAAVLGAVKVECGDLAQHREAALQLPADLATFAKEEDVHALAGAVAEEAAGASWYWVCTHSR